MKKKLVGLVLKTRCQEQTVTPQKMNKNTVVLVIKTWGQELIGTLQKIT